MIKTNTILVVLALLFVPLACQAHPKLRECGGLTANHSEGIVDTETLPQHIEHRIEQFLQAADTAPGVAVAIVMGEQIAFARGYGYRDLKSCDRVYSDTRFYLKSTTKTLLGLSAAILHEEGAIELDAPISEYLPDLRLPEGLSPQQVSIRSHLIHTQSYFDAGLNYRTAYPGNLDESVFVEHVNEFSIPGDTRFRYSNFGPIIAAHAIGRKTGIEWRDLIANKVFDPVGMDNSFTSMALAEKGPMAIAYLGAQAEAYRPTATKSDSQMHAAGGAVSTAVDLGRLLIAMMNDGRIGGEQAIPKRAVEQAMARQVQLSATYAEFERFAYGLGLYSADYDGNVLLHHFGGETHFSFMPDQNIGVVVLANEPFMGSRVTHSLASTIYDLLLDKPDLESRIDRRLLEIADAKTTIAERLAHYIVKLRQKAPGGEATFSMNDVVGEYVDARLGKITISMKANQLHMDFGSLSGPLIHASGDGYLADFNPWGDPPELFVFRTDSDKNLVLDWGGRIFTRS